MHRRSFRHDGLTFSYLDAGVDAPAIVALHGHFMEATTFAPLAASMAPAWRVVALDQRGHGWTDHPPRDGGYARDAYLGDVAALLDHLALDRVVLLGNSLGGVNAYQFAARHPERVRALVIEDIGTVVDDDLGFCRMWGGTFPSEEALADEIGPRLTPYLRDSFRHTPDGWRMAFEPRDMLASQAALRGDHSADWLATDCPALVIRGADSRVTSAEEMEEMVRRRPNAKLVTLAGSHVLHTDDASRFVAVLRVFLDEVTDRESRDAAR